MTTQIDGSLFLRANSALGGGASSPVRTGSRVGGEPFYQQGGRGALAIAADGREYIDYLMGYGPLLFGYRVIGREQIIAALENGPLFGSTCEAEIALAERICTLVPSMQRIRFASTGTEAVMGAVRLARAYTDRTLIVRFAGNYHGHSDFALLDAGASAQTADASTAGIPSSVGRDLRIATYNTLSELTELFRREGSQIAAVLLEPIVGNMGLVPGAPSFLNGVFRLAAEHGALVICDEVITWLRLGLGGAQGRLHLTPDLTTFGKILGGGMPIAGFGGRAEIMAHLAPLGPVFTGGTHAGNPLAVAAAHAVLDELQTRPQCYVQMATLAAALRDGLREIFREYNLDFEVVQLESIVDFKFRTGPAVQNYTEARTASAEQFSRYYHAMRKRGILLAPSQNEVMFLSTEHTQAQVDLTLTAAREAFRELQLSS